MKIQLKEHSISEKNTKHYGAYFFSVLLMISLFFAIYLPISFVRLAPNKILDINDISKIIEIRDSLQSTQNYSQKEDLNETTFRLFNTKTTSFFNWINFLKLNIILEEIIMLIIIVGLILGIYEIFSENMFIKKQRQNNYFLFITLTDTINMQYNHFYILRYIDLFYFYVLQFDIKIEKNDVLMYDIEDFEENTVLRTLIIPKMYDKEIVIEHWNNYINFSFQLDIDKIPHNIVNEIKMLENILKNLQK